MGKKRERRGEKGRKKEWQEQSKEPSKGRIHDKSQSVIITSSEFQ